MKKSAVETPKALKIKRMQDLWKCDRCPANRNENRKRAPRKSWKLRTKRKAQYK